MNQLVPISFHSDTIYLMNEGAEPYVPLRPIVENLNIDWKSQHKKLTDDPKRWGGCHHHHGCL